MKWFLAILSVALFAEFAFAQSTTTSTSTTSTTASEVGAEKTPLSLTGKLQSINWSGRANEMQNATGTRYVHRFEYELGIKHENGWGIAGNGRWEATVNGDSTQDKNYVKDPSVKIFNPIYKTTDFEASGMLRQYFPVSDGTTSNGVLKYHTAYYLSTAWTLPGKWTLENTAIPRYVSQSRYEDQDMKVHLENATEASYQTSEKVKLGVGNDLQVAVPHNARTGVISEIYPFVSYSPVKHFEISGKVYLPVLSEGPVPNGPSSVSTANTYGELSLTASL